MEEWQTRQLEANRECSYPTQSDVVLLDLLQLKDSQGLDLSQICKCILISREQSQMHVGLVVRISTRVQYPRHYR